ncbi:tyrosine protein kinase [Dyella jiangningensis]|jgi:tyrosine-protein kinase Etk/Wzc|uniref:polysaccharide biosynthesis tyrosine autokinase n=1 Tax=Dyella jiangningensis TaxID=1379159 RepID=UPI000456734B|nr:polysaccharide biosynthesis tyrosine autokinase [Dyella jiangningensis]AHX13146.1 tyrosine protein kinase [Dyella jiangningensis]MDG2538952.1 polysaccharide biosynthesis tyrosine autokinase [Dyella jiangningensis]
MTIIQYPSMQPDGEIDLSEVVGTVKDHKWTILGITCFFVLLAIAYALVATPVYQATAMVQVEQQVQNLPQLSALSQTLAGASPEATTETNLITSRMVIGAAVDKLNLTVETSPRRFPVIGSFYAHRFAKNNPGKVASPLLGMSDYDWGGSKLEVFRLEVPDDLLDKPLRFIAGEGGLYVLQDDDGNILVIGRVGQEAKAHGVTIDVKSLAANPGTRFRVFKRRELTVINGLQRQINVTEQGKESGILGMTYNNASPVMATSVLEQVAELYVRQNVERNSAEAANSLKFVRDQIPNVRHELERATAALNEFQNKAQSVDINMQTQTLLNQSVSIDTNLEQLRLQLADVQRQFTPAHPQYQALMKQIGQLQAQKGAIEKKVGGLPDTQQQLLKLTRDVQVSNETYTSLLNQAQQLDIARAGTIGNVRIIDRAAVDVTQPVWPRTTLILMGSALFGGFVALLYVFIRQMLNRGIEDPAVIEKLGLPVYATIPVSPRERALQSKRMRPDGREHVLVEDSPKDLAAEALRSLRTSLHFARLEAKNNVLMISGASPGAGKTFVSANLAAVVAQTGQRVLLIDGDMRIGVVHKILGGRAEIGLSELISGQVDMAGAIRQAESPSTLHYITRGKIPPNPSELLMNARFSALLDHLKPKYDLIIIDTPPILAATDAAVIGHHSGTGLLVARFGLSQTRELALAKQRFEQNGVSIKGAIFNAVEKRSRGYYAYAYYSVEKAVS